MLSFDEGSFDELATEVAFCLENIRHPKCTLEKAGHFYEGAAEALRGHAILRLLIDGDDAGFSNDLVMSAQARRAYLRRCTQANYADHFLAFSRSGSFLDAIAGDHIDIALEVFRMSPAAWRPGDEYEDDFCYQRLLGLLLGGASSDELAATLKQLDQVAEGRGARLDVGRALHARDATLFEQAFQDLLAQRSGENNADKFLAEEQLTVAAGTTVFVEGVAVLKLARRLGLPIAPEYPMCPTLALIEREPERPPDEFAAP